LIKVFNKKINFFQKKPNRNGITINNLCSYAHDAYLETSIGELTNREHILNEFREIFKMEILKQN